MNTVHLKAGWLALLLAVAPYGCASSESTSNDPLGEEPSGTESSVEFGQDMPLLSEGVSTPTGSADLQEPIPGGDQQAREVASLREQKIKLLVDTRLRNARLAYADGRMVEAESELLAALELDPANLEARQLLDEVLFATGRAKGPIAGSSDDARLRLQARVDRLRAETQANAQRGFQLLEEGQLDEAISALSLAQANIRGGRYNIDWGTLEAQVESALQRARAEQEISAASQRDAEKREAFQRLQAEEAALREQRQERLDRMLMEAIAAFQREDFDESLELSEEILRLDPLNARAAELRDTTFRARHARVNSDFLTERSDRFRRWLEDIEESMIPSTQIVQYPDPDHWAAITEGRKHFTDLGLDLEADAETAELMREINDTQVPGMQVDGETSLETVVDNLRRFTNIPIVVTPDAIDAVDTEGIEFNLNLSHPLSVANALTVITEASGPDVTYTFRHGVVYITTRSRAQGDLVLRAHDVQDLTAAPVDFSGPKIQDIRLPDMDFGDDDEEPVFGGATGEPVPIMDPANLETLVTQSIAPDTWDEVEGVSISYSNGFLITWHTPEVQTQIHSFLQELRRYISSMVTIEARFLTIQKDYLKEIGVDFRGLGGTFSPPTTLANLDDLTAGLEDNTSRGLDNSGTGVPSGAETSPSSGAFFDEGGDGDIRARTENILGPYGERLSTVGGLTMQFVFLDDTQLSMILRAVEKTNQVQELNSVTVSAQNTQRSFITVLNQITYVQDFDVEVAQAALIADPQVGVVNDGIVLDVRPTISHSRRYITLELRPTVASLLRPIPEFTSALAGLTTPVTLQLPELQVSSANTTVVVPDGGTVVIAGLKKSLNLEQRAEVPFLAKIPILSALFKAEGEANENEDVIILIRAHITDARQVMENLGR